MNIPTLRLATWQDSDFLYRLHRAALREYVEQTWGKWDEEYQQRRFRQNFRPAACKIITWRGCDVGVVCAVERDAEVVLDVIEVFPDYQERGIGTFVIQSLLADVHRTGKPAVLQVLKANRARRLYERLGFVMTGESETHYLMRALPPHRA